MTMKEEIKKMVDAYVEKQIASYKKTGKYERCYHRFQGYAVCLKDMNVIQKDEYFDVFDYMCDKFDASIEC